MHYCNAYDTVYIYSVTIYKKTMDITTTIEQLSKTI